MSMELEQLHEGQGHDVSSDRSFEGTQPPDTTLSRENAGQQRVVTAMRMGSLAAAAHHAAGDLEEQFPQAACYIRDAAAGCERIANLLHDPNLDEVATFIGKLGRRQPGAIVAAVVLVGLGLSWFLTNSGDGAGLSAAGEAQEPAHGIH
jgi:hypothetical protein